MFIMGSTLHLYMLYVIAFIVVVMVAYPIAMFVYGRCHGLWEKLGLLQAPAAPFVVFWIASAMLVYVVLTYAIGIAVYMLPY
ncbi:MAG: hypothetical protein ACYTGQ_02250 [Planctomycetota bacterium]|jgi:hypothetical protein